MGRNSQKEKRGLLYLVLMSFDHDTNLARERAEVGENLSHETRLPNQVDTWFSELSLIEGDRDHAD